MEFQRLKSQLGMHKCKTLKSENENGQEAKVPRVGMLARMLSFCFSLINDTLPSHSRCRLSYRRPSMLTAMSWLFPTTCLYITIPSMGEGLADSTLQKVRLLIWRMVGTFFASYNLLHPFSPLIVSFSHLPIILQSHT